MTRLPGLRRIPPPAGVRAPRLGPAGRIRLLGAVLLMAGGLIHAGARSAPPAYRDLAVSVTACSVSRSPAVAEVVYTVANHGVEVRSARLLIEYRDAAGRRIGTDTGQVAAIAPGTSVASATATPLPAARTGIRCHITAG
jgi:hypothetical protein